MLAVTPVLTALAMSMPVAWLVNRVFAVGAIHAVFGVEHLGYWRVVGLFALWFATQLKIKVRFFQMKPTHLSINIAVRPLAGMPCQYWDPPTPRGGTTDPRQPDNRYSI
jgi:hypothetical protein